VADSRVALSGGYGPDYDRLALTELSADRLHFLTDTSWYQLEMGDIP
jgi:hypothetical protein